jgi:flagellar motor component MotA
MLKNFLILAAGVVAGVVLTKETKRVGSTYDAAKEAFKNSCNECKAEEKTAE